MIKGPYRPVLLAVFLFLWATGQARADVNLSVNAVDGGNTLRFEEGAAFQPEKKEIRLRVTSTSGQRYQVFQRVMQPMTNEKGETLNLQAIQAQSLPNSNSMGTLYLQNADYLSMSEQLVYTSSQNGESDSFIIGYNKRPELMRGNGNYIGKIVFSVRAQGDGSTNQAMIDVLIENHNGWKVTIEGNRSPREVRINDADHAEKVGENVRIAFTGNSGETVRVYQELETVPHNDVAEEFNPDVLLMGTSAEISGVKVQGVLPVTRARTLVYEGRPSEESFNIFYVMDPDKIRDQDAGSYKGIFKYTVETDSGSQQFRIDVLCRIQPIFTMEVVAPPEGVSFQRVLSTNPPQEREMTIKVRTNLNKQYQVFQNVQAPMTNEKGQEFDRQYFTFAVDVPSSEKGRTQFADYTPVNTGEYPIFTSDGHGKAATFKVVYRLKGYGEMSAGTFLAPVRFSLNQN